MTDVQLCVTLSPIKEVRLPWLLTGLEVKLPCPLAYVRQALPGGIHLTRFLSYTILCIWAVCCKDVNSSNSCYVCLARWQSVPGRGTRTHRPKFNHQEELYRSCSVCQNSIKCFYVSAVPYANISTWLNASPYPSRYLQ